MQIVHKIKNLVLVYDARKRSIINVKSKYPLYFLWSTHDDIEDKAQNNIVEKRLYKSKFANGYLYIANAKLKPLSYKSLHNIGRKQRQGVIFSYFSTVILAEMNKIEAVSVLKPYINSIAIQDIKHCAVSFKTFERHFILHDIPLCSQILSILKEKNYGTTKRSHS